MWVQLVTVCCPWFYGSRINNGTSHLSLLTGHWKLGSKSSWPSLGPCVNCDLICQVIEMKRWLGIFLLFCSLILPLRTEKYAFLVGSTATKTILVPSASVSPISKPCGKYWSTCRLALSRRLMPCWWLTIVRALIGLPAAIRWLN